MPTGDLAYTPFNHQHPFAPDLRMQRDTINARDVISSPIRWEGMLVYVLENETTYQLKGGLTNEFWVVFGGTGDISNAVLYTIQSLTPEQQLQARTNIGAAELLDGLISLGAVTATGNDVTIASALARINGVEVGQNDPTVIAIPVPTEGYTRRDLIVIDENALIYLVQGTEVVDGEPALTPNVPADTVVLTEVFSNDAGLQDFYDFAFAHFVRFDINDQGLSPAQRLNARTNIQALSKDTNDSRTGTLTQTGLLTVIGDYTQTVSNSTASANAWGFVNTVGGGANFQRRGGLTVVSKGDSATDYFIIRGFDSTETEVFRVRGGGVTKGGDAINNDDFVTLGQVVGLIAAGDTTDMSATDFYVGHQDDADADAGVIYAKGPKDIIYEDSGAQFLYPAFMGNLVLANKDIVVNGVGYSDVGNEFSITNSTGVIRTLPDNFVGAPAQTAFDFGGVDLDIATDETVYFKANDAGTAWEVSTVNTVAFSDALNSVNSKFGIGPDGLWVIRNIQDINTGESVQFKEISSAPDIIDGVVFVQIGAKYYQRNMPEGVNALWYAKGDGVTDDTASIQDAVDLGFNVRFPKRQYLISGKVELPDDMDVYSDEGAEILCNTSGSYLGAFHTGSNNRIHGFTFIGNGVSSTVTTVDPEPPGAAVRGTNVSNVTVERCIFNDFVISDIDAGVVGFAGSNGITVHNCKWSGTNVGGKDINMAYRVRNSTVTNNRSFSDADGFLYLSAVTSGAISGSIIQDTSNHIVTGNMHIKKGGVGVTTGRHGIIIHYNGGDSHLICSNNIMMGGWRHGIYVRGDSTVGEATGPSIVTNNIVRFFGGGENQVSYFGYNSGIKLESTDGLIVDGNLVEDCGYNYDGTKRTYQAAGMDIIRSTRNTIVTNNIIKRPSGIGIAIIPTVAVVEGDRNVEKLSIKDNMILFPEVAGISIFNNTAAGNTGLSSSISIKGNTIEASLTGVNLIAIDFNDVDATSLDIEGNTLVGDRLVSQRGIGFAHRSNVRINIRGNKFINLDSGIESRIFTVNSVDNGIGYTGHRILGEYIRVTTNTFIDCAASVKVNNLDNGFLNVISPDNEFLGNTPLPDTGIGNDYNKLLIGEITGKNLSGNNVIRFYSSDIPAAEWQYNKGDTIINNNPTSGLDRGYNCIVSGTTGAVWEPFQNDDMVYKPITASFNLNTAPIESFKLHTLTPNFFVGTPDDTKNWFVDRNISTNGISGFEIAYGRVGNNKIWIRDYYSSAWTAWRQIPMVISATPSLDFPSIAAGATATLTATVTGAVVGDNVNVTGPTDLYASTCFIQSSWVSSANTVSVRVKNDGGSAVDLASGTYSIKVFPQ